MEQDGRDDTQFTFDRIFYSENSTQDDVYSATAKPVVQGNLSSCLLHEGAWAYL